MQRLLLAEQVDGEEYALAESLRGRLLAAYERELREGDEWAQRAVEHADVLAPLLVEAAEAGCYVRSAYVWPGSEPHGRYVFARPDLYWVGALKVLADRGVATQMVYRENSRSGAQVMGYRLLPEGDSRPGVPEHLVWAESGTHCVVCGIAKDEAIRDHCQLGRPHDFPRRPRPIPRARRAA